VAAILLLRSDVVGRRWAALALASQLAVPLYVFAGGWSAGVGLQGWIRIADWLGPTGIGWMQGWFGSLLAVSIIHALACIPWCCLIIAMGLLSSDRSEEETALLEGGWRSLIRYVWLPRLRPWLVAAALWCALGLLTEMVVSNLYMFATVAELVYLDVSRQTSSPLTYLSAIFLCFLPLLAAGIWICQRLPGLELILSRQQHFGAVAYSLGRGHALVSLALWAGLALTVGFPIFNLLTKAGWTPEPKSDGLVGYSWRIERFGQTVVEAFMLFQSEYYWSFILAVTSASVASIAAVGMYWWSAKGGLMEQPSMTGPRHCSALLDFVPLVSRGDGKRKLTNRRRNAVHLLMLLMIVIPGPLVGVLVAQALNRPSPEWMGRLYTTTLAAPVLAQQFRLLPCCWLLICAVMAGIPRRSWELAEQDGLSSWQTLRTVIWPQTWPKWLAIECLLLLLSVGELSCSMGVLPPGVTTTAMRLFEILHFGMRHQDSAICGILVIFGWLAAWIILWAVRRTT